MFDSLRRIGLATAAILMVGCAPGSQTSAGQPNSAVPSQSRTLVFAMRLEPPDLGGIKLTDSGETPALPSALFNSRLSVVDHQGINRPQLAAALTQLNTSDWMVSPDGRMETTYRLREGLRWHDGQAITAQDFIFSKDVYSTKDLGIKYPTSFNQIQEMSAPDDRTLLAHEPAHQSPDRIAPGASGK